MKIGILTLAPRSNYGGILQAYALQTVLKGLGHNPITIDTKKDYMPLPKWQTTVSRLYKQHILRRNVDALFERRFNKAIDTTCQFTKKFIDRHINIKNIDRLQDLSEKDFDAIIVGSDQVWRKPYFTWICSQNQEDAFLAFAKEWKIKRIAFSASFGTEVWEYNEVETVRCAELLKKFDAVSVRENSGITLCRERLGYPGGAVHVLDPTMLLHKEDYIRLISGIPESPGNMLCYVLDYNDRKRQIIEQIATERSLTPFRVNSRIEEHDAPIEERIQPPVELWLRGFYDADFVVTDSFHACVFAILFNKPFIAIGNKDRGMSRFISLLSTFGIEDRLIAMESGLQETSTIDWDRINVTLEEWRKKSMDFLSEALG